MSDRETGTVKWFNAKKGYGFIIREEGEDIFVHYTSIKSEGFRSLEEGQKVEFVVGDSAKGPQAQDVIVVTSEMPPEESPAEEEAAEVSAEVEEEPAAEEEAVDAEEEPAAEEESEEEDSAKKTD